MFRLALAAALTLVGCGAPAEHTAPEVLRRFVDLAFGEPTPPLRSSRGAPRVDWFFCGDQYRRGLWLEGGEVLALDLAALGELASRGAALRLELEGCLRRDENVATRGEGELVVRARAPAGAARELARLPLPRFRWWHYEVDLSALAGREVALELEGVLAPGVRAYLKDAALASDRPAAAALAAGLQVLLISVDALRADALAAYGGTEPTPHLDQLARDGELFLRHYAAAPWTKPSHASLLTGQPAAAHGVGAEDVLPEELPLVAELLSQRGLATGALVYECTWLAPRFGWPRGFDSYQVDHSQLSTQVRQVVDWIAARRERPFFFFLHTFEVHSDFTILPYEGPGATRAAVRQRFGIDDYGCLPDDTCASMRLMRIDRGEFPPLPGEAEVLRFLYDRGVQEVDHQLGRLFDALRAMGLYDRMLIVLTSDHGEMLLEHGGLFHSGSREEVLRVPLLVKWPGNVRAGTRNPALSGSIDLVPTLLAGVGLPVAGYPGAPLDRLPKERTLVAGDSERAVWRGRYKARFAGAVAELFDLSLDPKERHNLAADQPDLLGELRQAVERHDREAARLRVSLVTRRQALSDEERARLRALGYVH